MYLSINGTDFTNCIAFEGFAWSENEIVTGNFNALDGATVIGRVDLKEVLSITCIPMKTADAQSLLSALGNTWVTVVFDSPKHGREQLTMHPTENAASYKVYYSDGEWWSNISFKLTER